MNRIQQQQPHSVEGEMGVICAMIVNPKIEIPVAISLLDESYFYIPAHQTIFAVLVKMYRERQPIDLLTFTDRLRRMGYLEAVGGASKVTELFTAAISPYDVKTYAESVIETYHRRNIILGCTEAVRRAYDRTEDITGIKRTVWDSLRKTESHSNQSQTAGVVRQIGEMIDARQVGSELSLLTGVPPWDEALRGVFPQRFYALGARPKVGKSSCVEQAAQTQIDNNIPVLIFQRDMSLADMIGRMACRECGIIYEDFVTGTADNNDLEKVRYAAARIDPELLRIYSPVNLTAEELVSIIEREINESGIRVFYLDLFQRLKTGKQDRIQGLTEAANMIRDVIQTTGIPGVVIAEVLKEADKTVRPHSGQFKYCDGLFSACDVSIMLWSKDDPKQLADPVTGKLRRQKVFFTIDYSRFGGVGDEVVYFDRPQMKFYKDSGEDEE